MNRNIFIITAIIFINFVFPYTLKAELQGIGTDRINHAFNSSLCSQVFLKNGHGQHNAKQSTQVISAYKTSGEIDTTSANLPAGMSNRQDARYLFYFMAALLIAGFGTGAVSLLLLYSTKKKLTFLTDRNEAFEADNRLRNTFFNADPNVIFLKDENLNYILANKSCIDLFNLPLADILGRNNTQLVEPELAQWADQTERAVLATRTLITSDIFWKGRYYKASKFPVEMPNGTVGVGAFICDATDEYIQRRENERTIKRNRLLLEVLGHGFNSKQELLDYALNMLLHLSGSQYGYIYLYNETKGDFSLNSWTAGVTEDCIIQEILKLYKLNNTDIWGKAVKLHQPVIDNNFTSSLSPGQEHVKIYRYMSVPITIDERIVAVVGFANKPSDYDQSDIDEMTMLMSGVWNAIQRKEATEILAYERNKYYQTLLSIGDGVIVVDSNKHIQFMNPIACQMTEWQLEAAIGVHYKEVLVLSYGSEKDNANTLDPIEQVFASRAVCSMDSNTVLTSKTGLKYHLEDSASPILDEKGVLAGVVLVFRDVTEKIARRLEMEYMSFHDALTGLYNRRFFEEELRRIDTHRNLPISIIMGDADGLKLTNDIFGHACGDMLLQKIAQVMKNVCRSDDIIARWGGDEFVILLTQTDAEEAKGIAERIKKEVASQQVCSISCSISVGCDTKLKASKDILQTLNNAESKMYASKTLERGTVQNSKLEAVINLLANTSKQESEHAQRVSDLCVKLGFALNLAESEVQSLKSAGLLHDIGKIVLRPDLLKKNDNLSPAESNEVNLHPVVGYRILNSFDSTMELAEAVLSHHESWDGSGYPKGLSGDKIPLNARIIAVAEHYDRMTHESKNGQIKSPEEVILEISRRAGTQFDSEIVEALIQVVKESQKVEV